MICKIAGLGVDVPPVGNMPDRCRDYAADVEADIILDKKIMRPDRWKTLSPEDIYYMVTGEDFFRSLLDFEGFVFHSSCVVVDGYAYLFSGPCGMGKSTHTSKYIKTFPNAVIINDDKPALRRINGKWIAYGTPWCGKDGINENACAPVAGLCFLHRGDTRINRLSPTEAIGYILKQSNCIRLPEMGKKLIRLAALIAAEVPVFEFYNHADEGVELITYNAMCAAKNEKETEK